MPELALLYLCFNHASGYIEEKNGNKYWLCWWKQRSIKKYADVWDGINKIKAINGGEKNDYRKDYIKTKFNSDDDLPLNKSLKFHAMTITLPTTFFRWHFVWIIKMLQYERIDASEGTDVNKTSLSKECELCHYWFLKDGGFKSKEHICNGCHDLLTMAHSLENIAILNAKGVTFRCILWGISRNEGFRRLSNSVLEDKGVL